ncbi:unnamed protein product [Rotaria sordida]|uniref:Uncharacterized protein n=1 Tax=Rotaria sordida TaxID=392033 RepID=A0A815N365_9BILA|nr:unnamed protein product [Rotaria sordida]CAF1426533.1 unnamed protein product [Rotaria sordida]
MSALSSNTKYYKEAYNLFQQCSSNNDRHDLANKVFEEITSTTSDTIKITNGCSRELENLLPYVTSYSILTIFFDRLTSKDHLDELIRDRSACFVLEKLLVYLPNILSQENEQIRIGFNRLFECICENFHDYIQETGTSHIIASTISFLHPLISSNDINNNNNEYEELIDGGQTEKEFFHLSSEWNVMDKLQQIIKLIKKSQNYNEFVYATLLRTCGYLNKEFYKKLINRLYKKYYTNLNIEHLLDKHSSFIFEVILEFSSKQRDEIIYSIFLNDIDQFYLHPIGNFFFKHLLLTLNNNELIEKIYPLIIDENRFNKFIQQTHIHLLITFIRICERFHCHYEELINRLNKFINKNKNNINDFIPCLLKLRAENPENQIITKEGSLVVQALLRAKKIDSLTSRSFISLTGEQISSIACHPSGSYLLCQLILKSNLWLKLQEKNFYNKLDKFYTKMACDKSACWFVTQLWKNAKTIEQKLQMAKSMSNDLQLLRSHTYAKFITYEMNLIAYCSRPDQWKRSIETMIKKHSLLDNLDDDDDDDNNNNKKKKKRKRT